MTSVTGVSPVQAAAAPQVANPPAATPKKKLTWKNWAINYYGHDGISAAVKEIFKAFCENPDKVINAPAKSWWNPMNVKAKGAEKFLDSLDASNLQYFLNDELPEMIKNGKFSKLVEDLHIILTQNPKPLCDYIMKQPIIDPAAPKKTGLLGLLLEEFPKWAKTEKGKKVLLQDVLLNEKVDNLLAFLTDTISKASKADQDKYIKEKILGEDIQKKNEEARAALKKTCGNDRRAIAANLVARHTKDFMVQAGVFEEMLKLSPLGPKTKAEAAKIVKERSDLIVTVLETRFFKMMNLLSERIKEKAKDETFMHKLYIKLIDAAAKHFGKMNSLSDKTLSLENSLREIFASDPEVYPAGLGPDAMDSDHGKQFRTDNFYKDLVKELMAIMCPKGEKDLDLPDLLVQVCGLFDLKLTDEMKKFWDDELVKKILPSIFFSIYQTTLSTSCMNTMLLSSLNNMTEEQTEQQKKSSAAEATAQAKTESKVPADIQKELNRVCGNLIKQVSKLFPETLVKFIFLVPGVKGMTGEKLGAIISEQAKKWDIDKIIDNSILNGLPAYHDSEWSKDKDNREVLFPRQKVVKDGKVVLKDETTTPSFEPKRPQLEPKADFHFPFEKIVGKDGKDEWIPKVDATEKELKKVLDKDVEDKLKAKLFQVLRGNTEVIIPNLAATIWQYITFFIGALLKIANVLVFLVPGAIMPGIGFDSKDIDAWVNRTLFETVCNICNAIFMKFLWRGCLFIISKPIDVIWNWHLNRQCDRTIKILHLKVNEALLGKVTNIAVESLKK